MLTRLVTVLLTSFLVLIGKQCVVGVSQDIEEFFLVRPEGYKPRDIPPSGEEGSPFSLRIGLDIWAITDMSLEEQHMEVDLVLTVSWIDSRLSVSPHVTNGSEWLEIGNERDFIWTPVLAFQNCKGCSPIAFKSNNYAPMYVHAKTKELWTQVRKLIKFTCDIHLRFYPMDIQNCQLQIYPAAVVAELIVLKHYLPEGARSLTSNITLAEFVTPIIHTGFCTFTNVYEETYSCLDLSVRFERLLGYHLVTSYLPTTLIVGLSWISFWIPIDGIPARVALGLTSLLTLSTRLDQAQKHLPAVSYAKAIDVWMLACIVMVSLVLVEFAIASSLARRQEKDVSTKKPATIKVGQVSENSNIVAPILNKEGITSLKQSHPQTTFSDSLSKIAFPVAFAIFSLVYWTYYLNVTPY